MGFKKGQSGNPGGRPKALETVTEFARAHTDKAVQTLARIMDGGESESSRVAAAIAILDRGWGKPAQAVALTGSGLQVSFVLQNGPSGQIIDAQPRMQITGIDGE